MPAPIRVLFFASARDAVGCAERTLPCAVEGWTEAILWEHLLGAFPALVPLRASVRLAKNHEYLMAGSRIFPGDEVALIPPVSGG